MFADSLLDTRASSHQGWATLASFGLQGIALCGVLLLPLLYTQHLPQILATHVPDISLAPPPPPPPMHPESPANTTQSNLNGVQVVAPSRIPEAIAHIDDHGVAPPPIEVVGPGVPGSTGDRFPTGIWGSTGGNNAVLPPPPQSFTPRPPRISHMMEGNLIYRVQPTYPPAARTGRIQGPVVLRAVISKDGTIENLRVLTGHPFLVKAALEAVSRWRYRPYILNGETVEVETQVTVNFILSGQ